MATEQQLIEAAQLSNLAMQIETGNLGRGRKAAEKVRQQYEQLGGEAKLNQLMADPEISGYLAQGSGSGLALSNIMPSRSQALQTARLGSLLALPALAGAAMPAAAGAAPVSAAGEFAAGANLATAEGLAGAAGGAGLGGGEAAYMASIGAGAGGAAPSIVAPAVVGGGAAGLASSGGGAAAGAAGGAGLAGLGGGGAAGLGAGLTSALVQGGATLLGNQMNQQAIDKATEEARRQFDIGQRRTENWYQAGAGALQAQQELMGLSGTPENQLAALVNSPGYRWRQQSGQKATEAGLSARGGMGSGKAGTALTQWGQNFATGERANRLSELATLSGTGQMQAQRGAEAGQQLGSTLGSAELARGQSRTSTLSGLANAYTAYANPTPRW